jgi:hypothetical protein
MTAKTERERSISTLAVYEHALDVLDGWDAEPADVVWAIQKGASHRNGNDPRAKRLAAAVQFGASRIVPYNGDWIARGNHALLAVLNLLEREMQRRVELTPLDRSGPAS